MPKTSSKKTATILYVDDEQWLMGGIVDSLSVDYKVFTASNADQALEMIKDQNLKIDLILLDVMMPSTARVPDPNRGRTSGVQLARRLLQEEGLQIPIVCYTVVDDRDVLEELREIGVKEVVSKDRLPSELEQIILEYLR